MGSLQLLNTCYEENSVQIDEKVVSHIPARMYGSLNDLAKIYEPY
jgi:hypothetical protein